MKIQWQNPQAPRGSPSWPRTLRGRMLMQQRLRQAMPVRVPPACRRARSQHSCGLSSATLSSCGAACDLDGHGFVGRRTAMLIVIRERHEAVGLRVIGADRAAGDVVSDYGKPLEPVRPGRWQRRLDIDDVAMFEIVLDEVIRIHEDDVTPAKDTAIP